MGKLIGKDNVQEFRVQLKAELEKLRKNYIPGAILVPKGVDFKDLYYTVNMIVTADDIRFFTLGLYICDTIDHIIDGDYTSKDVLYLLDAENDLGYYLKGSFKSSAQQPAPGIETPDLYFLKTVHLMCTMIRDNLEIKVNLPK